MFLLELQ